MLKKVTMIGGKTQTPATRSLADVAAEQAQKEGISPVTILNRIRRRYGINPQKVPHAPKSTLQAGKNVRLYDIDGKQFVHNFLVAKVKSDGRLRIFYAGWAPDPGTPVSDGDSWHLVTAQGSQTIYTVPISKEEALAIAANDWKIQARREALK